MFDIRSSLEVIASRERGSGPWRPMPATETGNGKRSHPGPASHPIVVLAFNMFSLPRLANWSCHGRPDSSVARRLELDPRRRTDGTPEIRLTAKSLKFWVNFLRSTP